jgi:hypothetical protein
VIGTVNFDSNVLSIVTSTSKLAASDFLANTGVNYLNPANRGLEAGDSVTISGQRQILFDTTASSPGDYVRVLTAFSPRASTGVPEPGSVCFVRTWRSSGGCPAGLEKDSAASPKRPSSLLKNRARADGSGRDPIPVLIILPEIEVGRDNECFRHIGKLAGGRQCNDVGEIIGEGSRLHCIV